MFTGTTPPEVKIVIQDIMSRVKDKEAFCACSGNYTTDKTLATMGFNVHSNDVSLYSKLISDILLGKDTTPIAVKDERFDRIFQTWEEHPYKKLAMVMYIMKIANMLPQKNAYQIEMLETYMQEKQHQLYYHSTIEKLNKGALDFKIKDFFYGDFAEFLRLKRGKGVGVAFPPTYKGGYEKIFQAVEETFDYEHAPYEIFDPKNAGPLFKEFLDTDRNIIYTDREFEELEEYLMAKVSLGPGKHPVYLYSSVETELKTYYIEKSMKELKSKYKTLPLDYEFTEDTKITVKLVSMDDVNYFKPFYMANKVNYTNGGNIALMFFADGLAFGFITLTDRTVTDYDTIFGLSDFVVNSHTKKLSKLLIMCELSHEVRMALAREFETYYTYIQTSVYTDKPVSMKYRGVFKLDRREKGKLVYTGEFTDKTINEIYKTWLQKYKK